jgi:hypothetical protein
MVRVEDSIVCCTCECSQWRDMFRSIRLPASRRWCLQMSIHNHNHNHNSFQLLSFLLSLYLLLLTANTTFSTLTSPCRGYKGHTCSRVTPATDHALIPLCADYQKGNFQRGKFPLLLPFAPAFKEEEIEISQSLAPSPGTRK